MDNMNSIPVSMIKINDEFKNLIRPLQRKEYLQLEENILADGCRDPIITWKGYILDGHNRYEICTKHHITFQVREMKFVCKEEAIAWICKNQLGRRNISEETKKYLIGLQYEAEKTANRYKNYLGINQYTTENSSEPTSKPFSKNKTALRIADENHITHATVQKYSKYSRAINKLKTTSPDMVSKILAGKYKISHDNIIELSNMSTEDVKDIEKHMARQHKAFVHYNNARTAIIPKKITHNEIENRTTVKDMPVFDPDAPLTELSLTIPSWSGSIKRLEQNAGIPTASIEAKQKLIYILNKFEEDIKNLISILSES